MGSFQLPEVEDRSGASSRAPIAPISRKNSPRSVGDDIRRQEQQLLNVWTDKLLGGAAGALVLLLLLIAIAKL